MTFQLFTSRRQARKALSALALAGASTLGAMAAHADSGPDVYMNANGVDFVSGGIGSDQSAEIRSAARHWPASFEFAVRDGQRNDYVANVLVSVRNAAGSTVLSGALAEGPFMLTQLDPGRYQVEATLGGRTLTQRIVVRPGSPSRSVFVWPAGTDTSSPI